MGKMVIKTTKKVLESTKELLFNNHTTVKPKFNSIVYEVHVLLDSHHYREQKHDKIDKIR